MSSLKVNNQQLDFLDLIALGSTGLGIYNTILNQKQISNDELLKKIIEYRQKEVDEIIEKIKQDNDRVLDKILKALERR